MTIGAAARIEEALAAGLNSRNVSAMISPAERWMAYACIHVERGLRRIRGHADLPELMAALRRHREAAPDAQG